MPVTTTSETPTQTEQLKSASPTKKTSRKSILALSIFALGINGAAAVYTLPSSGIALPDISRLAALLPHESPPAPAIPESVVATLNDIQSAQQHQAAALQENGSSLQQNTALLQQDSATFDALRHSLTDEQVDVKNISAQLSTLIAKVDSLQNAITSETTSSIPKARAHNRLSGVTPNRSARWAKPLGPVSIGGAPLPLAGAPLTKAPAQARGPLQSPAS
jgi:hypothetical protein